MPLLLCADIGGTNARLQLWEAGASHATDALRCDQRYPTQTFESAEPLLRRFLADAGLPVPQEADGAYNGEVVDVCAVAICMPVEAEARICGPGGVTWALDMQTDVEQGALGQVIKRAVLLNDFVAVGLGLHAVAPSQVQLLTPAVSPVPRGQCLCLGPGTGLGTCYLTWNEKAGGYSAYAGEGGATEFAARTEEEWQCAQPHTHPTQPTHRPPCCCSSSFSSSADPG